MQEHLLWTVRFAKFAEGRQDAARGARAAVHRIFRNGAVVGVGDVRKTRHSGSDGYGGRTRSESGKRTRTDCERGSADDNHFGGVYHGCARGESGSEARGRDACRHGRRGWRDRENQAGRIRSRGGRTPITPDFLYSELLRGANSKRDRGGETIGGDRDRAYLVGGKDVQGDWGRRGNGQNVGRRSWWHRHAINGGRNVGGAQGNGGGQTRAGTDRCYGGVARSPSRGGGEVFRAATGTERGGERVLLRCGRRAAAERNGGAARRNRQILLAGCDNGQVRGCSRCAGSHSIDCCCARANCASYTVDGDGCDRRVRRTPGDERSSILDAAVAVIGAGREIHHIAAASAAAGESLCLTRNRRNRDELQHGRTATTGDQGQHAGDRSGHQSQLTGNSSHDVTPPQRGTHRTLLIRG